MLRNHMRYAVTKPAGGKLDEWRQHVRIPGGVSKNDNVLSGVPQGLC